MSFNFYGYCRVSSEKVEMVGANKNVARFSVATDNFNGTENVPEFYDVTAFGKLAERVQKGLVKGQGIVAEGRLQKNNYTDKEGRKRSETQLILRDFKYAGPKPKGSETAPAEDTTAAPAPAAASNFVPVEEEDDELPFN